MAWYLKENVSAMQLKAEPNNLSTQNFIMYYLTFLSIGR